MRKSKTSSLHQPILTKGFVLRGQVDLFNFQSMPEGHFKHLMKYQDLGKKLLISTPMVAKKANCVAYAAMEIFTLIGPPIILQCDNGREFRDMVRNSSDQNIPLYYQFIDDVIRNIKNLWPEVQMVSGSQCRSESNSGTERMNLTTEKD